MIEQLKNNPAGNFFLLAGPCVIEGEEMAMRIAERVVNITDTLKIPYIFKGSYRKANRSRLDSFMGIGDEKALKILKKVHDTFGVPTVTDIHSADEATMAAEYVDVLQIPAFLCRQTDILIAAAKTGKVVNIKKGQFLSPMAMQFAADKVLEAGNKEVMLTEPVEAKRKEILLDMLEKKLENNVIKLGTRGSELARIQTDMVLRALQEKYPMYRYETVILTTKGDRQTDRPITAFGGKAVFVEEIEQALTDGTIDIAVHSAKDMPNPCGDGLTIAGTLPRACVQDVLIYPKGKEITKETAFTVGTGSLRRRCQIQAMYPKAECRDLRGNVGTRIAKLKEGNYDAIVLAAAGIERQGLDHDPQLVYEYLPVKEMLPAAGQAIIAVETRRTGFVRKLVKGISDETSAFELEAERAVLTALNAGCHEPIGVLSRVSGEEMSLDLMIEKDELVHRVQAQGQKKDWEKLVETVCWKFRRA
mgnify:CR=1 FL=1